MSTPLPVISLMNSLMTIQAYLHSASTTNLPPVIAQNPQYDTLVTDFRDWQQDLWTQFWEGLLSAGIVAQSSEVNSLFQDQIDEQTVMQNVFYEGPVPVVVSQCDDVANFVTGGQGLLTQLEAIAASIQNADQQAVDQLTKLADQLSSQFDQQEDKLTQEALDSATDVVSCAVDVMLAVGTEGDAIAPLVKGVIKLGTDAIDELALTDEINQTLSQLEAAWKALDQATADLAQITLTCNQLKAVTDQASATLTQLQNLSNDWSTVAATTQEPASGWASEGSAALQAWAAQMVKLSFTNATQAVSTSSAAARSGR